MDVKKNEIILFLLGITLLSIFIGEMRCVWIKKQEHKKKQKIEEYESWEKCIDKDFPYSGPDFTNRFETDPWDFRG